MGSGVVCESRYFRVNSSSAKPSEMLQRRRRLTNEACRCVCFGTHLPRTSLRLENHGYGSGDQRFRAKAAVNDGFVVSETDELSFYQLLGIPESGSSSEIKQAYKQLARKYHPDVSPPDRTEEYTRRFILVQEAYETLSDPTLRALYDRDLSKGLHLAFSARKRYSHRHRQFDEDLLEKNEWRYRWQDQLSELKRKSKSKESRENMSWAARMRRQRDESLSKK